MKQIYKTSPIENLMTKTDFYYQFRMCIFRTNFFGIRLTICSTISNFLFWRYLRLCPFVDCIGNIIWSKIIFIVIFFYREVLCVVLSFICFEYYHFLYASSFPCIYFKFVSVKVYEVVLLRFDSPHHIEDFCLLKENKKILSFTPFFIPFKT
jgi:hypothetical protein